MNSIWSISLASGKGGFCVCVCVCVWMLNPPFHRKRATIGSVRSRALPSQIWVH